MTRAEAVKLLKKQPHSDELSDIIEWLESKKVVAALGKHDTGYSQDFETWWLEYPVKIGKKAAYREWCKLSPDEKLQDTMIDALREWVRVQRICVNNGDFFPHFPHAERWIKYERWGDDIEVYIKNTTKHVDDEWV